MHSIKLFLYNKFLPTVKKGVTKTLQEYFGTSKRKHLAALKIQAAFRGYQVRKMMKKDNKFPMKNKNYANTETVDHLRIKCLPTTSAEPEIGAASLIREKFRSRDPQQLDILGKYLPYFSSVSRKHCDKVKHCFLSTKDLFGVH
jgi:hypothetical protein